MRKSAKYMAPARRKFLEWLTLPEWLRVPHTQERLAEELHVAFQTLSRWKQEPEFQAELKRLVTASLGPEYPNIMGAFIKKARAGDVTAIKTAFEMLRVYIPMQGNMSKDEAEEWLAGVSTADIDRAIISIVDAARKGTAGDAGTRTEVQVGRASKAESATP